MSIDEQNNHPLYKDAHERFLRAEEQQNIKAAAKYPEPLNPESWTAEGLADHAAQEAVDMLRYIEALKAKCEGLEAQNAVMKEALIACKGVFLVIKEEIPPVSKSMGTGISKINNILGIKEEQS